MTKVVRSNESMQAGATLPRDSDSILRYKSQTDALAKGDSGAYVVLVRMRRASEEDLEERLERLSLAGKYGAEIWTMYKNECRCRFVNGGDATMQDFLSRVDALAECDEP